MNAHWLLIKLPLASDRVPEISWPQELKIIKHTHFRALLSGTTRVSQYQKGKTNLDFTEARDNEWQWHQLGHMQVCTLLQGDNHASTPPLSFLQARCPSFHPTNTSKHWSIDDHMVSVLFHCGLSAVMNPLQLGLLKIHWTDASESCTCSDAQFTFLLIGCKPKQNRILLKF